MRWSAALPALAIVLAGCAGQQAPPTPDGPAPPSPNVLAGVVEAADFTPPVFDLLGAVAAGGPLYGAGEPGIAAAPDGSLFVTFPGCDDGPYYFVSYPGSETCGHGLVYKSMDDGATWMRLNRAGDGRLEDDAPEANGDADLAIDAAGTLYASNLGGGGIQFHRSLDGGNTWQYMANIVPPTEDPDDDNETREGADRQWLAAGGPGHVINAWMRTSPRRDVRLNTTFDGGVTWTGNHTFGDDIGWLGTPQFAPDGLHAYLPYTQPLPGATNVPIVNAGATFAMRVLSTADGGRTWTDLDTGMRWQTTLTGLHWSGGHMAPTLDVTGDGTIVVAMAIDSFWAGPAQAGLPTPTNTGTTILYTHSRDGGASWAPQRGLAEDVLPGAMEANVGTRVFPWVTGGAGDRFAITFYATPTPVDNDAAGTVWSLKAVVVDGITEAAPRMHEVTIDPNVHEGPICTRGGLCGGPADRTLLDYFESDVTVDGRLVVVYPADSLVAGKDIEIRVARQDGGSRLFERAPS